MSLATLRFMVVDDSVTIRRMVVHYLNALGVTDITEAESGRQAWNLMKEAVKNKKPFQIVISDWHMPDMEGPELIALCRADPHYKTAGLLMLTSEADTMNVINAIMNGADDYALKPISQEVLKTKLTAVAHKRFGI